MIDPLPYATYAFVMSITPGPNNLMLTASGATFGLRRTLPHMLGISLGCAVQLLLVCAGLGALFTLWPVTQTVMRWAGTAYLLYLGWRLLGSQLGQGREKAEPVTVLQAALFQFLNPKAWIMNITAATVFLPQALSPLAANAFMVSVEVLIGLPCIAVWALFGTALRRWLAGRAAGRVFNAVMALSLAATAVIMAL